MTIFEQAAKLNNDGVKALAEGDCSCAVEAMTSSIKLLKMELSKPGADLKDLKTHRSDMPNLKTVEIPDMDTCDNADLFNQAIHIPYVGQQHSDLDIHVYSAVVIFNLALAHHQQVVKGEAIFRPKAEKLYSMVLRLLDDSVCHMRSAVMVKLATINNLAQMLFANGDYQQAREGLGHLTSFMRQANESLLEEPEIQGLLMNVLLLKAPKVAPAA